MSRKSLYSLLTAVVLLALALAGCGTPASHDIGADDGCGHVGTDHGGSYGGTDGDDERSG